MSDSPTLRISIGGCPLAIVGGEIYAMLASEMGEPVAWTATAGKEIQFTDQASQQILCARDTRKGTPVVVMVRRVVSPVMAWNVAKLDDDGDAVPVTEITESGYYILQAPGTDLVLTRKEIEDYSIRPKPAVLGGSDTRWGPLVIQVI